VEIVNLVDKERLKATNYFAKNGKESVNFAFPFNVPEGELLIDLPIGAMRPEVDQMPSACKNWVTVGRWIDVANEDYGVTWVTLDAPLVEVGEVSATLLNSQTNPEIWRKRIDKTQRFYSWAMNNHWGTNYRAYQDGPTIFRFVVRPHRGGTSPAESTRFATGLSHPLTVTRTGKSGPSTPLLKLSSDDVIVTALKPSDQGNAWIVRLYGASGKEKAVKLTWGDRKPSSVTLTDTSERPGEKIEDQVSVPGYGIVSLRVGF
jgi:alpha-mannosidase